MRSKVCEDGKRRILAKVEVPVDQLQILTYALAHPMFNGHTDAMNEFENLNKRQLFNLAKDTIQLHGVKVPYEMIDGMWSKNQIVRAKKHVAVLFPEVD